MAETPDLRAARLTAEIGRRWSDGKALGRPSFQNIIREVLIEEFDAEPACTCIPYHLIGCPEYAESWRRRAAAATERNPKRMRDNPYDEAPDVCHDPDEPIFTEAEVAAALAAEQADRPRPVVVLLTPDI